MTPNITIIACLVIVIIAVAMLCHILIINKRITDTYNKIEDEKYYTQIGEIANSHVKEEQLFQAKKEAQLAIQKGARINEFVNTISPFLKQIISDTKLLTTENLNEENRGEASQRILHATDEISAAIEKVLYMARIDSDNIVYSIQENKIADIITSLYNEYKDEDGHFHCKVGLEAPLQIHLSQGTPDISVNCDAFHLRNALAEILKNAICYSKRGDILMGWYHHLNSNEVHIFIEDTGVGIAPEDINKVFDPFYKVNPDSPSAGVGLTIAKSIVEKFNGRITLESRLNYSTRCCVILPTL